MGAVCLEGSLICTLGDVGMYGLGQLLATFPGVAATAVLCLVALLVSRTWAGGAQHHLSACAPMGARVGALPPVHGARPGAAACRLCICIAARHWGAMRPSQVHTWWHAACMQPNKVVVTLRLAVPALSRPLAWEPCHPCRHQARQHATRQQWCTVQLPSSQCSRVAYAGLAKNSLAAEWAMPEAAAAGHALCPWQHGSACIVCSHQASTGLMSGSQCWVGMHLTGYTVCVRSSAGGVLLCAALVPWCAAGSVTDGDAKTCWLGTRLSGTTFVRMCLYIALLRQPVWWLCSMCPDVVLVVRPGLCLSVCVYDQVGRLVVVVSFSACAGGCPVCSACRRKHLCWRSW